MATGAFSNVHDVAFIAPSGDTKIDAILLGFKYAPEEDGTYQATYSVPEAGALFNDTYMLDGVNLIDGFFPVGEQVADWFRTGAEFISSVSGLQLSEIEETGETFGHIRVIGTTLLNPPLGAGVFGDLDKLDRNQTGDIFIDDRAFTPEFIGLSRVVVHELGHAVGLSHPGEGFQNAFEFPADLYGDEYTLMDTNFASVFHADATWSDINPSTLMYVDVLALQYLYGENTTATSGNDTYTFDLNGDHYMTLYDTGGHDTLVITGTSGSLEGDSVTINLSGEGDQFGGRFIDVGTTVTYYNDSDAVVGTREETVYLAPETKIEVIQTANGNDVVNGDDEANTIKTGAGDDVIAAGGGNDTVVGGTGNDVVDGGTGHDKIWAGAGDAGNDIVSGFTGNDTIAGGGGDDLLAAGTGRDVLFGGSGDDTLAGENWLDGVATGDDTSNKFLWGGAGDDKIFGVDGSDKLGGGTGNDTLEGRGGNDTLFAGASGNDSLSGEDGDDLLFGGTDDDTLNGGEGADTLYGGVGNDFLDGGDGADTLYGGAGDDTLTGSAGDDMLRPGAGADVLVFEEGSGNDVVSGFSVAEDTLDVTNFNGSLTQALLFGAAEDTIVNDLSGLMITYGDDSLFIIGVSTSDLFSLQVVF